MDIASISEWLKGSILGIILLGAIGSIISVFLLKYIAPLIRALGLKPLWYFRKEKMWRYWRSAAAYAHIEHDKTNRKLIYYLFRHIARLVLACSAFITTVIVLTIAIIFKSDIVLTYGTFILSTLMFLLGYWIKTEYDYITINYIIEWRNTGLVKNPFPEGIDTPAKTTNESSNQKAESK